MIRLLGDKILERAETNGFKNKERERRDGKSTTHYRKAAVDVGGTGLKPRCWGESYSNNVHQDFFLCIFYLLPYHKSTWVSPLPSPTRFLYSNHSLNYSYMPYFPSLPH